MTIKIEYLEKSNSRPIEIQLTPEEYFDSIEEGDTYEKDGIPKFRYVYEYLGLEVNKLVWSRENIYGAIFTTYYYNDGKTWVAYRCDLDGYEEIIHNTQIDELSCHIIRTCKKDNLWQMLYNGIVYDNDDGSQGERRFI